MNRRTFLGGALRLAATVAGAAVLVAPLDPKAIAPAAPVRLLFDPRAEAWAKTYSHYTWTLGVKVTRAAQEDDLYYLYQRMAKPLQGEPDRVIEGLYGNL